MPRENTSFWYSLGRTVEVTTSLLSASTREGRPRERRRTATAEPDSGSRPGATALTGALSALLGSAALRWTSGHRPGLSRLLRGAAAGAGAAGIVYAARVLLEGDEVAPPEDPAGEAADELLAGAGRGILYAAVLDRYLPGPPILRGSLAGTVDYLTAPIGGLFSRLQPLSPVRRIPILSILLETGDADDEGFLTFLLHGAVLGLLYGEPGEEG